MSTEPLLPPPPYASSTRDGVNTPTTSVIQSLSLLIFSGSAIVSTFWAWRSNTTSDLSPPASAPLLPYFASLCLVAGFCCWVGYLAFISCGATGGPRVQRKVIIWTSITGKLILAGVHIGSYLSYKNSYPDSTQPNWILVFLAAQAWWDFLLVIVCSRLRGQKSGQHR
jgi:hypothetical protein